MLTEFLSECPFCGKLSIKILRIPFVKQVTTSKCRAGGRNTTYQRERDEILSGCSECGKSKKEIQNALNGPLKKTSDAEMVKRLKKMGMPTTVKFEVE